MIPQISRIKVFTFSRGGDEGDRCTYRDDHSQITSNIPNPLPKPDPNSRNILGTPRRDLPCTDMVEKRKILP